MNKYFEAPKVVQKWQAVILTASLVVFSFLPGISFPQVAIAHSGAGDHTFSASVSPASIDLGDTENFTFTVTNTGDPLATSPASWAIQSFTILVPTDFSVTNLTVPTGWQVELDVPSNEIRVSSQGGGVEIAPDDSLGVSGDITSTGTSGGNTTWTARAFKNSSFTPGTGAEFHGDGSADIIIVVDGPETGSLTVTKETVNGDDTFGFSYEEGTDDNFDITTLEGSESHTITDLAPGTYSVTEISFPNVNWSETSNGCAEVQVVAGEEATCTIINTFTEPETEADLEITKSVDLGEVEEGGTLVYTLTVENFGPDTATNVVVLDSLHSCLAFVEADASHGSYDENTGEWTITSLDNEGVATLTLTVTADCQLGTVLNSATVSSADNDPDEESNESSVSVTVSAGETDPVLGCTDSSATNYNPDATAGNEDAEACTYPAPEPDPETSSTHRTQGQFTQGGGSVLGAFTAGEVLGESCGLYMDKFIRRGRANDAGQVMKLQTFLNKWMNAGLPITGFYGPLTNASLNAFQTKYASEVLSPWGLTGPTGIAYLTTLRQINMLECPELALALPPLVNWSQNPNVPR